ncbi:MAG: N-glycosylase/DNA lyase [Candidatus Aenigmarchaeota archaeon]|nr:N-glycosylase/DNA lyase [Candidatus Aenigmarchaeota archaeon]
MVKEIQNNPDVSVKVKNRIQEFQILNKGDNETWFNELCFCLLTANSSAKKGIDIQNYLSKNSGFSTLSLEELTEALKRLGHRFYRRRAEFIVEARGHKKIKDIIKEFDELTEARRWLAENIKGLGYKESSHFLRNVGYHDLAILDRHVLRILNEYNLIEEVPKSLTPKKYLEIEKIVLEISKEMKVLPSEMDLYLWYSRTGKVLK